MRRPHRYALTLVGLTLAGAPLADNTVQEVIVEGDAAEHTPMAGTEQGEYRFNRDYLDAYRDADGGLDSLYRQVPGIQFSEDALETDALEDLSPSSISISGGRFYQNAVQLDGLNIGNRLDPAGGADGIDDVGGHELGLFLDTDLLESVRVLDSNVPVEYGRFTGGVVDLETRRAGAEPEGAVFYNTTRSDWVHYKRIQPTVEPGQPISEAPSSDPEFRRDRFGAHYSLPVGELSGLILSASQASSRAPTESLGRVYNLEQTNQNLMGKFSTAVNVTGELDASVTYAPYEREALIRNARDSRHEFHGGGLSSQVRLMLPGRYFRHQVEAGVSYVENRREAPLDYFQWANSPSRQWGSENGLEQSLQGGYGNLDKYQMTSRARWIGELPPLFLGEVAVDRRLGLELNHQRLRFDRPQDLYVFTNPVVNTDIQCRGLDYDCLQEEQYFSTREVYAGEDVEVGLTEAAAFTDATFHWDRYQVTAGLRYDYDDFLRNHNVAPRLSGSVDAFDNGATVLTAGANRYYGGALLTYKMRQARTPYATEYRGATQNVVNDWTTGNDQGLYRYGDTDLDTPYSDELSLGLRQRLLGGVLEAKLVQRDNQDEFAQTVSDVMADGYRVYRLNNDGESEYKGVSLAYYRAFGDRTTLGFTVTYSEQETSNADYDDPANPGSNSHVSYQGERVTLASLNRVRGNFDRPWVANLNLSHRFAPRWSGRVNVRYRGDYDTVESTGQVVDGEPIITDGDDNAYEQLAVYERAERHATLISDLGVTWRPLAALSLEAEIRNAFNARTYTVPENFGGVELGRYFWLGARYRL